MGTADGNNSEGYTAILFNYHFPRCTVVAAKDVNARSLNTSFRNMDTIKRVESAF